VRPGPTESYLASLTGVVTKTADSPARLRALTAPVRPAVYCYRHLMRGIDVLGWHRIRLVLGIGYLLWLAQEIVTDGVPTDRARLSGLIVIGLSLTILGRGWRRLAQVLLDWLPFTLVLMTYDKSRALADSVGMPLHLQDIAAAERWLFGGNVPAVWLQDHFAHPPHAQWYDAVASITYSSHFIVTPVLAAVFWLRNREVWFRYISRVIALSLAGLVTYVLFPEAPPWLAAQHGYIGPVSRLSALGWSYLHADFATQALESGQSGGANPVAAMPSLHFAFAVLAAIFLASRLGSRWRRLIYVYPAMMALTLLYTGEHYLLDEVAGLLYAVAVHLSLGRAERWWQQRGRETVAGPDSGADAPSASTDRERATVSC
jgi:hypothetical protein